MTETETKGIKRDSFGQQLKKVYNRTTGKKINKLKRIAIGVAEKSVMSK